MGKRGALMSAVKFREVARLWLEGYNASEVARSCGCARSTAQDYMGRAAAGGLTAEMFEGLSDSELLERLGKKPHRGNEERGPEVDWAWVSTELRRRGVTLALLWEECIRDVPQSYSYSAFCRRFRKWEARTAPRDVSLRQVHKPGEKVFVDFSGLKLRYVDIETGLIREAEIFVGALGASNFTYVEACPSQALPHWIGAHLRMFRFFGGVPAAMVPDNLKSGVSKALWHEPDLNQSYLELARHYGTAILPARANKPKDKPKVEKAVQDIQHWILAPLRDRIFHSVAEINAAIRPLLDAFLDRTMREFGISRRALFERIEKGALKALPALPFELALWKHARVNIDYHVEFEKHYYSVPYYLVRKNVEIRATEKLVEVFFDGKRAASHLRSRAPYQHSTVFEHMPPEHQAVRSWTRKGFESWGDGVGPETRTFVDMLFEKKEHPEQAFRAALGLQRLATKYGALRLENACARANHYKLSLLKNVRSILETSRDKAPLQEDSGNGEPLIHDNLRGVTNFH